MIGKATQWLLLIVGASLLVLSQQGVISAENTKGLMPGDVSRAVNSTITVTTTDDELNSDGDCSLREAVEAANTDEAVDACAAGSGTDTIHIPAGTYLLTLPNTDENRNQNGDLDLSSNLILSGAGAGSTFLDGNSQSPVLDQLNSNLTIRDLTIQNGLHAGQGGGLIATGDSGDIITIERVAFINNEAERSGAINVGGPDIYITDSLFKNNSATGTQVNDRGGAIGVRNSGGNVTITNSTFSGNKANGNGGAIGWRADTLTLTNVSIIGNSADFRGASGKDGGGISNEGGTIKMYNTIVLGNFDGSDTGSEDCVGTFAAHSYNLVGAGTGCPTGGAGDQTSSTPSDEVQLTLADNGGETETHALASGSAAINQIATGTNGCGSTITTDQRGTSRDSNCDVGAFEMGPPEIDVTGNGTSISDGDTTPTENNHTDFSSVTVGSSIVRTFAIANNGDGDLTLGGSSPVAVSGTHTSDFVVTVLPSTLISARGSTSFQVTFTPSETGSRTATLSISNNDSDEDPYNFSIAGTGLEIPNSPPIATDDVYTTGEDTPLTDGNVVTDDTGMGADSDPDGDSLTASIVTDVTNGVLQLQGDGSFAYTPQSDFNGTDTFVYAISDGDLTDTGRVTITVNAVNDSPIAVDDMGSTNEDVAVTIDVVSNDTDVDLDTLSVNAVSGASNGLVSISDSTTVIYTPTTNFNGTDSFDYAVTDGTFTDTGRVTITIHAVNDAPVAVDDSSSTNEDEAVTINVITNDTDVEMDSLSVSAVGNASNGLVSINGSTAIIYTPTLNFNGIDTFEYTVSDGHLTATGAVTVTIVAQPDPVIANDDSDITLVSTALVIAAPGVVANDADPDGSATVALATGPSNGSVTLGTDGSFTYTPIAGFVGTDRFTYTLSNGAFSDTASVSILVIFDNAQVDVPLYTGWNLVGYPLSASKLVTEALLSITGHYTSVLGYDGSDISDPWKQYDPTLPPPFDTLLNDLITLEQGEAYWVQAQTNTILSFTGSRGAAIERVLSRHAMEPPPMTVYGYVDAEAGELVQARFGNVLCGESVTEEVNGSTIYGLHISAESAAKPGCGSTGKTVTLVVGDNTFASEAWSNETRTELTMLTPSTIDLRQVETNNTPIVSILGVTLALLGVVWLTILGLRVYRASDRLS